MGYAGEVLLLLALFYCAREFRRMRINAERMSRIMEDIYITLREGLYDDGTEDDPEPIVMIVPEQKENVIDMRKAAL